MKFDNIVMNPPYSRGSHMDHINNSFELLKGGGKLVCIHPSTPFINNKKTNNSRKIKSNQIVNEYKSELKLVNGNEIFDAEFYTPLSITSITKVKDNRVNVIYSHYNKTNEVNEYNNTDDVFIHGNDIVLSIRDRVQGKLNKSIGEFLYRYNNNISSKIYIKINTVVGHPPKDEKVNPDFYCIIYRDYENKFDDLITYSPIGKKPNKASVNELGFETLDEAKNGFEYLKTKFARFCLSLRKTGPDLNFIDLELIPYMDFTQEWIDEKLKEYFGLTDEEWQFIDKYIGDWYESDFSK